MKKYDFANILFTGPCNLKCPYCIGSHMGQKQLPANLDRFPLAGLDEFIQKLNRHRVRQVSITGANTDPQLYAHEERLIARLREGVPGVKLSLHTNGTLALKKIHTFNRYDRASVSLPSFIPETCRKMTGVDRILDLKGIIHASRIPLKISTLITDENIAEIPDIITRCRNSGITRMSLRKLYGETREFNFFPEQKPYHYFGENPVYLMDGMEITVWDFSKTDLNCLNLFSNGVITEEYEICKG